MAQATKNFQVSFRVSNNIRDALRKAASDDNRSVASYAEKVLLDDLRAKGYLPGVDGPRPAPRKRKAGSE